MSKQSFSLFLCALLFPAIVFAQGQTKIYFINNRATTDTANADYYRVITPGNGSNFTYIEYHKDGTWITASGEGTLANWIKTGDEKYFFKNGHLAVLNYYQKGRIIKTTGYYPNGVLMQIIIMRAAWPGKLVAYDADSSGRIHIINGNGVREETDSIKVNDFKEQYTSKGTYKDGLKDGLWKGKDDRGFLFEEKYEMGKLVSGKTQTSAGKKYRYSKFYEYPAFGDNIDEFERHIIPNLKTVADTTGLKFIKPGYLKLGYTINQDGGIISVHGFKQQDNTVVELALKDGMPKIEPAKLRGVPIAYIIYNNADQFIRNGFKIAPFQTDIYLNGTYRPAH